MNYVVTIGLEVHVQLKTRSKMFCSCEVEFGAQPKTRICPICLGLPGALPVMNHEALRMTAMTGLMLGCDITPVCKFDRKNYFYPDMPKNYQISQYDMPLCTNGSVPLHDFAYPKDAQKNIATTGVRRALAYEIRRQLSLLERCEKLEQQNRGWDDAAGETFLMRTKEFAHDYRYFPDPDLVPVKTEALLADVRERVPELPKPKRSRFVDQYQVSPYDAGVLANDLELARYFEAAAKGAKKPKNIANWILNDLQNALGAAGKTIDDCPIPPEALDELVNLIDSGKISGKQGKEVFAEMFGSGKRALAIVKEKGIEQLSDLGAIEAICDEVIAANPKPVADFKAGNVASMNFLTGQVIKLSKGKANPQLVGEILERRLKS